MTPEKERELWIRCKEQSDPEARETLVVHYMRTVKYIAGRMAIHVPPSVEMDDLIGWGVLGLLDAVDKFDPTQDVKFSTYSSIRIRGSIIDQIRTLDWAPRSLRSLARKVGNAKDRLRQELGEEPTPDAIAEKIGITADEVEDTISQMQTAQILSLDDYMPSEEGGGVRKSETVGDSTIPNPEQVAQNAERQELLVEAILNLPEQQQKVLNLYYYEELTLKEIGAVLDVSESRVCQINSAAMKKLRKICKERS